MYCHKLEIERSNNVKKIIVCILAILLLSLTACQNNKDRLDYLVLVNKENRLPEDWEEKLDIVKFVNSLGDEVEVERESYEAYLRLKAALEKQDIYVDLDSAYRSVALQQEIWDDFMIEYGEEYTKSHVAVPGYSEHQTGIALDLYLIIDGEEVYLNEEMEKYPEIWDVIHSIGTDYGFIVRYIEGKESITGYAPEVWHLRYVGSSKVAKEIMDKGITLEEYLNRLPEGDVAPK